MAASEFIEDREELRTLAPVAAAPITHHVFVCTGKSCSARDSAEVLAAFDRELKAHEILFGKVAKGKNPHGSVVLTECASVGFCAIGAAVMIYPDGVWYAQVHADDVPEIVEEHIISGRIVDRLALMRIPVSASEASATGSTHMSVPGADRGPHAGDPPGLVNATGSGTRGEDWDA
jgi:(2Fe-2S) ferredoxin